MITIDEAIARVPQWMGGRPESVTPLAGGITNLNYRVEIGGETFVLSIAGTDTDALGVDRASAYECTRIAGRIRVGPEVVCALAHDGILVTRFVTGRRPTAQDAAEPDVLARIVRSFRQYHDGPAFPAPFSPFETLRRYLMAARESRTAAITAAARSAARLPDDAVMLYERMGAIERATRHNRALPRPCHNDLWQSNLIDDGRTIWIVDWEYAGMGDAYFDLANFAIHNTFEDAQDAALLRAYFGAAPPAGLARLKLLKAVAELREAIWAVVAQRLPATLASGFDVSEYASTHFDRCRRALADPRTSEWLDRLTR